MLGGRVHAAPDVFFTGFRESARQEAQARGGEPEGAGRLIPFGRTSSVAVLPASGSHLQTPL